MTGYELLGNRKMIMGASSNGDIAVVVRLRDLASVVKEKGGAAGKLAVSMAPQTIAKMTYEEIRTKLAEGFKAEGVDADVQVSYSPPPSGTPPAEFLRGVAVGSVGIGILGLAWMFVRRIWKK